MEQRDIVRAILELSIQAQAKEKSRSRVLPVNSSSRGSPEGISSRSMDRQASWPDERSTLASYLPSRSILSLPMKPSILMAKPPQHLLDRETSTHNEETSNDGRLCNSASRDSVHSLTQGECITTADCTPTRSARGGSVWTPTESTVDWNVETGKIHEIFLMKPIIHDLVDVIQLSWRTHKAQMQQHDVRKQINRNKQEGHLAVLDLYQNLYDHEYRAIDSEVAKAGSGASLVSLKRTTSNLWHRDIYFKGVPGLQFVLLRMVPFTGQSQHDHHPVYKTAKPQYSPPSLPVSEAELVTPLALHSRTKLSHISTETAASGASINALSRDSTTNQTTTARTRDTADGTDTQVSNQPKPKRRTAFGLAKRDVSKPTPSGAEVGTSQVSDEVDNTGSGKQTLPPRSPAVARPLRHKAKLPQLVTRGRTPVETKTRGVAQMKPKPAALKLETSKSVWENASSYLVSLQTAHFIRILQDVQYPTGFMGPNSNCNYGPSASKFHYDIPFLMQFRSLITETSAKSTIDLLICSTNKASLSAQTPRNSNLLRSGFFFKSPTSDTDRKDTRPPNKLRKKRMPESSNPSAHSSTQSLSIDIEHMNYSRSNLAMNPSFIPSPIAGMQHDDYSHESVGEENEPVLDEDDYEKQKEYEYRRGELYSPSMVMDEGYGSGQRPKSLGEPDQEDAGAETEVNDTEDSPKAFEETSREGANEVEEAEDPISSEPQAHLHTMGENVLEEKTNKILGTDEDHRFANEETDFFEEVRTMTNSVESDASDDEEEKAIEDTMDEAEAERVVRDLLCKYTTLFATQGVHADILET